MKTDTAYRLSIASELRAYTPEVLHVCSLLHDTHGLTLDDGAATTLHYGANPPAGAICIPAHLFPAAVTIAADGLHLDRLALDRLAGAVLPQDNPQDFDAIGLVFLLSSRLEERDAEDRDPYGRYKYSRDFQVRHGLYGRPVVDETLDAIARLLAGAHRSPVTEYRVYLTHDVDRLKSYHRPLEPVRLAAGDLIKRRMPQRALRRLGAYLSGEPYRSFNDIMALSERFGLSSHFYFMGPTNDSRDSPYVLTMASLVRRMADQVLQRGHHLGFHPGHGTSVDSALWQRQRAGLEAVLGHKVKEGRQHMLSYEVDLTPDIWDAADMALDLSLAYPEVDGFRTGSCRPLPVYSIVQRRTLHLRQASTAIMDFGLFDGKYRDMSVDEALQRCRPIIQHTRRHCGTLVILFHTGQMHGKARALYEAVLDEAA